MTFAQAQSKLKEKTRFKFEDAFLMLTTQKLMTEKESFSRLGFKELVTLFNTLSTGFHKTSILQLRDLLSTEVRNPEKEKSFTTIMSLLRNLRSKPALQRNFSYIVNDLASALPEQKYFLELSAFDLASLLEILLDFKQQTNQLSLSTQNLLASIANELAKEVP